MVNNWDETTKASTTIATNNLRSSDWSERLSSNEVNHSYNSFQHILRSILEEGCLMKIIQKKKRSKKAWLTPTIINKCNIKRQLYEGVLNNRIDKEF